MLHKLTLTDSGFTLINSACPSLVFRSPGLACSPLPALPLLRLLPAPLRPHHLLPAPPPSSRLPARAGSHARPAPLPAAPAPFTSAELQSRGRSASRPAAQPLGHPSFSPPASPRLPPPRPQRSSPSRTAPREDFRGGPRPASADWLPPRRPAPVHAQEAGRARGGRARRGPAGGASVTRVPASASRPGRPRGGGRRRLGAPRLRGRVPPRAPSCHGLGGAPQPRPAGRPARTGSCPRGRRRRQPGSPDVAAPRGGAADALLGPGRRLLLKRQRPVRGRGGAASCPPCATPAPRGRCAAAPSPLFRAGRHRSAARPPPDGRRWPPRGQVFLWPEPWPVAPRGAWRRRPVIGRGRRECRTLSGRGRLCPCPPPSHGSKWVRSEGPGPPAPPARGSCPRWAHRGGRG